MKNFALILLVGLFSYSGLAQETNNIRRSNLSGPAYKNYKPGKQNLVPVTIYIKKTKKALSGPAYKNYKPWRDTSITEYAIVRTNDSKRQKLKGPAYKNYKPNKYKSKTEFVAINSSNKKSQ